jgi:hypothetical protein
MESAIISGESKKDIQLLMTIAKKMGIKAKMLHLDNAEDFWLGKAIEEGRTGELVDINEVKRALK